MFQNANFNQGEKSIVARGFADHAREYGYENKVEGFERGGEQRREVRVISLSSQSVLFIRLSAT
jgi:hypothetical protein